MAKVRRRTSMVRSALELAQLGFSVFPMFSVEPNGSCHCGDENCTSPGKHPNPQCAPNGLHNATTDLATIRRWWSRFPMANVAIATGQVSGIVVLDIDPRHRGDRTLKRLDAEHGALPPTVTARTGGGGKHLYFRYPGGRIASRSEALGHGIDVKADGGCVTAPPSRHASGRSYRWAAGRAPSDAELAKLPEWLLGKLKRPAQRAHKKGGSRRTSILTEGERNDGLIKVAGAMRRQGCSLDVIRAALRKHNEKHCRPHLEDAEVCSIAKSALRYAPAASDQRGITDPHTLASTILAQHYTSSGSLAIHFYHGGWWIWEDGRYRAIDDVELRAMVNGQLLRVLDDADNLKYVEQSLVANAVRAMESKCLVKGTVTLPAWLGEEPITDGTDLLAMANGLLDLDAAILEEEQCLRVPTPDWFSLTSWPFGFDPKAKCRRWRRVLKEVLPRESERFLLQEYLGYCLTFDTSQHRFLVLVGEGANGKSVVTEVATHVLGRDNVTHVGLERFGDRFSMAPMMGRLANIVSELGAVRGVAEDFLKAIVSGDRVQVEFKFKSPVYVSLTTRLLFATNELPVFRDRSRGLWRRLMILPFNVTIPEEKQDKKLARTICDTEAPGVFNWMLAGLRRLRSRGAFRLPSISRRAVEGHRRASNPALAFLEERCRADQAGQVPCSQLYSRYAAWCEHQRLRPLTKQQFGQEVRRTFPAVRRVQRREGGDRQYYYVGLSLRSGRRTRRSTP